MAMWNRPTRRELVAIGLILVVACLLRGAYLVELSRAPDFDHPPVDGGFMLYWAKGLATGDWSLPPEANGRDPAIRSSGYLRSPGYAYVLAGLYALSGGSQLGIRGLQLAAGVLTVVLAWVVGRRLLGPSVAVVWAALLASSWVLIYYEGGLHGMWLVVALALVLILALHRFAQAPTTLGAAAVAAVVGLIALERPNVLLVVPGLLVWGWWVLRRRGAERRLVGLLATAVAVGGAVLAPPVIRTWQVEQRLAPVSSNAGFAMITGNNPRATGASTAQLGELGLYGSPWDMPDLVARLAALEQRPLTVSAASAVLRRRSVQWLVDHPGSACRLYCRKVALFWGPDEIAHNAAVAMDRAHSPLLSRLPMPFSVAFAGGLVGLAIGVAHRRREGTVDAALAGEDTLPAQVAVVLFVVFWFASFLPFFVASLYRVPVVAFLLLGCAVTVVELARLVRRRRPLAALALVAAVGLTWSLTRIPLVPVAPGVAKWHCQRGLAWAYQRQPERAEAEFRAALAAEPQSWEAAVGLAAVLVDSGRAAAAEPLLRRAVGSAPAAAPPPHNHPPPLTRRAAWGEAAEAFAAAARLGPRNGETHAHLGAALEQLGQIRAAAAAYEDCLKVAPGHRAAANNLAWILATTAAADLRDGARAVVLVEAATRASRDPAALDTLAAAYAESGNFAAAVVTAEEALAGAQASDPALTAAVTTHLAAFRQGQPWREPTGGG